MKFLKNNNVHIKCILVFSFVFSLKLTSQVTKAKVNTSNVFQKIVGFGASDAWRCQFVGENWPNEKKEKIAEWLFSKEFNEKGNPKGIGLSFWRFYIGAGTAEQGDDSLIKNEWRRAESFINSQGNYNWNKQKGQQWFIEKAKDYGVNKLLAFSISAPVQWTKNGKGFNGYTTDGEINLKPESFDDYAQFMTEFLKHFKSEGVNFDYISPINEPQWNWETKTQEGTPATNNNISALTKLLNAKISENNLETKIVVPEAADLRFLYSNFGKPERASQIDVFFGKNSSINGAKHLENTLSGHSYFTTWPVDSLITIRKKLNIKLKENNVNYWQSEFCIIEKSEDIGGGVKRDLGINTALYVARVIHADLTLANATSWQWWTALTIADYKDGLIYLDTGNEKDLFNENLLKEDGVIHDSKILWALGNYSRFVRPNMVRVEVELDDYRDLESQYNDVMLSAFKDEITSEIVIVAINYSQEPRSLDIPGLFTERIYVTSKNKNLETVRKTCRGISLEARSISTIIGYKKNKK